MLGWLNVGVWVHAALMDSVASFLQERVQELERGQRKAAVLSLAMADAKLKAGSSQKEAARQMTARTAAERLMQCAPTTPAPAARPCLSG